MFRSIEYLKQGNDKQRLAYKAINRLGILNDLAEYTPILCGTLPINIDIDSSDLDIIMEVNDFRLFEEKVVTLYGIHKGFKLKKSTKRNVPVIKVNFFYDNFEFELFGQSQAVIKQYAYLHMIIEHKLLQEDPDLRRKVVLMKKQGFKTEPAFCEILGLNGDPYKELIDYGIKKGIIQNGNMKTR